MNADALSKNPIPRVIFPLPPLSLSLSLFTSQNTNRSNRQFQIIKSPVGDSTATENNERNNEEEELYEKIISSDETSNEADKMSTETRMRPRIDG